MIIINNLRVINGQSQLQIDIETNVGSTFSSLNFWKMNDFKNPAAAINLDSYLLQTSNIESITIDAVDIGLLKFEDLCFIEVTSTFEDETSPTIGITYDLSQYYGCMLSYLLEIPLDCTSCDTNKINQMVITMNMLIDSTIKAVDIGYYTEAIAMVNKLKTLCNLNKCTNCAPVECTTCNNFIRL